MTEFSVCSTLKFPRGDEYYEDQVICGDFKTDPYEARDSYQQRADMFVDDGASYSCGKNAIRVIARHNGSQLFGTGSTPKAAEEDILRAYKDHVDSGFLSSLGRSFKISVLTGQLESGEPIPYDMIAGYFNPPLCSLPYEVVMASCSDEPYAANPCDESKPRYVQERIADAPNGKGYEPCSENPCSLNPCDNEVQCEDPEFYIENGMFVPPPSQLGDANTREADRIKYLADPIWAGQQYD